MRRSAKLLCICLLLIYSGCNRIPDAPTVGIQPLGSYRTADAVLIQQAIQRYYGYNTVILPEAEIPSSFFVQIKSPRYRADSLIRYLRETQSDSIDYTIGITSHDISTTKRNRWGRIKQPETRYADWGIFGLGFRPGPSCIVSTFRLGSSAQVKQARLEKIALHELGHNLGLPHCDSLNCVMRDAAETIKTIDQVENRLCRDCWNQVH